MKIKLEERFSSITGEYVIKAVDNLGVRHRINPFGGNPFEIRTNVHLSDRRKETFALEQRLNGKYF